MTDNVNSGSTTPAPEDMPRPKKTRAKKPAAGTEAKAPPAKKQAAAKARKTTTGKRNTEPAAKSAPKKKPPAKRKSRAKSEAAEPAHPPPGVALSFQDPIGDLSDGEARTYTGEGLETEGESEAEAYRAGVAIDAVDGTLEAQPGPEAADDQESLATPATIAQQVAEGRAREIEAEVGREAPAKLERLQKILSQAGIASRRRAEEMIVAGRVMVNGQVVTALGSKADPERDHIRVDGKLLHGAERHRYFVLNKPKGYVTTVSDPEGRPTVMEFVRKLGERLYPVGRLDYQSEGLLLMTNDGALANQLTHASSGVEKTYVVKIAGQPDEEELERLRSGVMIERGGPASSGLYGAGGRVRTAPARIRQIRPGENPWYEVVLTEGRNRELRKMFSAIGHYVEKIRRVGYGPLALDLEPGQMRELTLEEVETLRLTAEGKLKPRRIRSEAMLPKEAGRSAESREARRESWRPSQPRPAKPYGKRAPERAAGKDFRQRGEQRSGSRDFRGRGQERFGSKEQPQREFRGERREWQPRPKGERPAWDRSGEPQRDFGRRRQERSGPEDREFRSRPNRPGTRQDRNAGERPPRAEGRAPQDRGKGRFGAPAKYAGKARPGGFGGRQSGRGPGGFTPKSKPGGFRAGPRPGGRPSGGKRRG